jgi:hypothetical protein
VKIILLRLLADKSGSYGFQMQFKEIILILLCFAGLSSQAGPVSLRTNEVQRLRALVVDDPGAAAQLAVVRAVADKALADNPDPVKAIFMQGHLEKDPKKIRSTAALKDREKIEALGWAWAATGDEKYGAQARKFLLAWAKVNQADGDAINETFFEPLIVAFDLLRDTFSPADRQVVDEWLRNKAETLWNSKFSVGFGGNWYSHRLKIVGLIGLVINGDSMIQNVTDGYRRQIKAMIKPDGATTEFYIRDSLSYHLYSIEPLLTLARAMERHGEKLYDYENPKGVSLRKSVDFVIPFTDGRKTHVEFANSTANADHWRATNGESHYAAHPFSPKSATRMLSQAAWFNPEYGKLAAKTDGHPDQKFIDWRSVINAAGPR